MTTVSYSVKVKSVREWRSYRDIPKTYEKLCEAFLPRPACNKNEYNKLVAVGDKLAVHQLNADQEKYFELISILIADFDDTRRNVFEPMSQVEALNYLVESADINGTELARILGLNRSMGTKLLAGERKLTTEHIMKLASHFQLSPSYFLQ